jgi:hypothetical protein
MLPSVFKCCKQNEVRGIDAGSVLAGVVNLHAGGNMTLGQPIREAMCNLTRLIEVSITLRVSSTYPPKAATVFFGQLG